MNTTNYSKKKVSSVVSRNRSTLMLGYQLNKLKVDPKTKVPIIEDYNILEPLPSKMVAFHKAMYSSVTDFNAIVHFFEEDSCFIKLFRNPDKYIPKLKLFKYVLSPDLSQFIEMPFYSRYANNCHNKALAQYLQSNGVNIIVNVTWSLPDSYSYCFSGIPTNTIIAINSNGVNAHSDSKYLWQRGYKEALRVLKPKLIIRYGQKMPNECDDISIYYDNEELRRLRYGR